MSNENKNKKENWFVKAGKALKKFFGDIKMELKKVAWMKPKQVVTATLAVLGACLLVGAVVWLVDLGMSELYNLIFG